MNPTHMVEQLIATQRELTKRDDECKQLRQALTDAANALEFGADKMAQFEGAVNKLGRVIGCDGTGVLPIIDSAIEYIRTLRGRIARMKP